MLLIFSNISGGDERSRAESLQMTLLDRVSREAEASLKSSGASFLGSVMLQEKKASIKDFKMLKVCWMCHASTGMVVVDINIIMDVLLYQCKGICVYDCGSSYVLSILSFTICIQSCSARDFPVVAGSIASYHLFSWPFST